MSWNQDFASTPTRTGNLVEELNNDPTVAGGPTIEQVQHEPSTDLTRIIWASEPTQGVKDAASAVVSAHSPAKIPAYQLAQETADTTTTSSTPELANGMSLTPMAGTYLVKFSGSVKHNTSNEGVALSIYAGGTQVPESIRKFKRGGTDGDITDPFYCIAEVTVDGMEAIEGRWSTPSGTATMHQRQLLIERVG